MVAIMVWSDPKINCTMCPKSKYENGFNISTPGVTSLRMNINDFFIQLSCLVDDGLAE